MFSQTMPDAFGAREFLVDVEKASDGRPHLFELGLTNITPNGTDFDIEYESNIPLKRKDRVLLLEREKEYMFSIYRVLFRGNNGVDRARIRVVNQFDSGMSLTRDATKYYAVKVIHLNNVWQDEQLTTQSAGCVAIITKNDFPSNTTIEMAGKGYGHHVGHVGHNGADGEGHDHPPRNVQNGDQYFAGGGGGGGGGAGGGFRPGKPGKEGGNSNVGRKGNSKDLRRNNGGNAGGATSGWRDDITDTGNIKWRLVPGSDGARGGNGGTRAHRHDGDHVSGGGEGGDGGANGGSGGGIVFVATPKFTSLIKVRGTNGEVGKPGGDGTGWDDSHPKKYDVGNGGGGAGAGGGGGGTIVIITNEAWDNTSANRFPGRGGLGGNGGSPGNGTDSSAGDRRAQGGGTGGNGGSGVLLWRGTDPDTGSQKWWTVDLTN